MRSSARISRTPGEWHDHQQAERDRTARALLGELREAAQRRAPWYVWLELRSKRTHAHDLKDGEGRPVACPFPGCAAIASVKSSAQRLATSSAIAEPPAASQMELIA